MSSLVTDKTQLQKDIENDAAGVIPIFPWAKNNREGQSIRATKDNMVTNTYARRLLEGKTEQHQEGMIRLCDSGFSTFGLCPYNSQFWRSNESSTTLVPSGWITYNNDGGFTMCPLCRSHDLGDFNTIDDEYRTTLERDRAEVDASTGHSGSTSSGNNKSLPPLTYSRPRNRSKRKRVRPISSKELLKQARGLFKGKIPPEDLKGLEDEIKKEERDKRAKAAESRKRRKTSGGKRRKKRTRRRKSRGKSRRRMRGKRKGKSRRKRKR